MSDTVLNGDDFLALDVITYFTYLDGLRLSGTTNMMGAGAFLQREFDELDRKEAGAILKAWVRTFDDKVSAEDRAYIAIGEKP